MKIVLIGVPAMALEALNGGKASSSVPADVVVARSDVGTDVQLVSR